MFLLPFLVLLVSFFPSSVWIELAYSGAILGCVTRHSGWFVTVFQLRCLGLTHVVALVINVVRLK